ncbi:MAG: hypothetical protein LBD77_06260, partial [Bifidobacteriaceae bacterium]|nr:hypothetical protein [Bifidobacteriaceae bacterium]
MIIVAEKPSAARAFETALGGREGRLRDGRSYQVVNLRGHLFDHKPPADQPIPGSTQSGAKLGGRGIGEWVADVAAHPERLPWGQAPPAKISHEEGRLWLSGLE